MKQKEASVAVRFATILATIFIVLGTYFFLTTPNSDKKKYDENNDKEYKIDIGEDFELTNLNGKKESTKKFSNKLKLIYFGFTYCPDICPMALNTISETIKITDKYNIDVIPIFVTIDPDRDTPEILAPYLLHFHKKMVGYTGTKDDVKKVADLFRVYYAKVPRKDAGPNDYLMDHSSFIYLMSGDSKYIKHFSSSSTADEIASFIHKTNSRIKE